ncbi:MAG: Gfo/Idh/MocA family oxidoreductase [Opitutaceae bacterium]|nr:Gfo/Idh/MocA family oxidoreductase [Opitutaceae bacterium]
MFGGGAPSNHLRLAVIGCGSRSRQLVFSNSGAAVEADARIVATCDCFTQRRETMAAELNTRYGANVCAPVADHREVLARADIDGVIIAAHDHWHVPLAHAAALAGKDVYVEKPLTPALAWAFKLREAAARKKIVVQYGTQQRSNQTQFRRACEFVRNGYIGKIKEVVCWCPDMSEEIKHAQVQPYGSVENAEPPAGFDYDRWLGPAPEKPYTVDRCTRFGGYHIYDYSLGFIAGWGAHPLDIAQWGLDADRTSPVRYEGTGLLPLTGRLWDSLESFDARCDYAGGVRLRLMGWRAAAPALARRRIRARASHGTHFIGEKGWITVDRSALLASDRRLQSKDAEVSENEIRLKRTKSHMRDFFDCMRSRETTISPLEAAIRSDTISHLANAAIRLDRPLRWDPDAEKVINDDEAAAMLDRPLRAKWNEFAL